MHIQSFHKSYKKQGWITVEFCFLYTNYISIALCQFSVTVAVAGFSLFFSWRVKLRIRPRTLCRLWLNEFSLLLSRELIEDSDDPRTLPSKFKSSDTSLLFIGAVVNPLALTTQAWKRLRICYAVKAPVVVLKLDLTENKYQLIMNITLRQSGTLRNRFRLLWQCPP